MTPLTVLSTSLAMWNGPVQAWSIVDILVMVVIVAACVGLMYIALRQFGVTIPP